MQVFRMKVWGKKETFLESLLTEKENFLNINLKNLYL